jgi:uncharacterized protein (TIGR03435 family)
VDGYVLTKGKGEPKARAAAAGAPTAGCQTMRPTLDGPVRYSDIQCRNVTMDQFGQTLRRMVSGPLGNLPVKDATGLEGGFDIDFQYVTQPMTASGPANAGVLEAVEKMGLKLAPGKVPQQVLAVESVNEQPTADPPGAAAALPPLPAPQFEVAAIEWPCHDNMSIGLRFEPGGRVTATCEALGSLIRQAWGLAPFQQPEGVTKVFGPSGRKYDISIAAKAPEGVALDPQHSQQARDILNAMLRSLLIDRYKMAVHYEDRPVDAYTLVASKPKLTKADPANRTGCKQQGQQQQAAQNVKLVCRNMTMQQFAEQIQAYDSDIYYPVQDGTGIEGAWDFTIDYNPMAGLIARLSGVRINGTAAASEGEASEPNGSISFAESLGKIGLKLETHKRPEPVLVIDHIAEKPTEN